MRTHLRRRKRNAPAPCRDPAAARIELREWFEQPLGQRLLATEKGELATLLPNLFGYHAVLVGQPAGADLLEASRIRHRMVLDENPTAGGGLGSLVRGAPSALPFAGDSLDLLVLAHTLEFQSEPHEVLREADRCLIPEGHVVIIGFNPWSLWGAWRWLSRGRRPPWCGHFYSQTRLRDWLALLGFDTVFARGMFFRPPLQHEGVMNRLGFLERAGRRWWPALAGGYVLVARKRVATLTPIRPRWRPRRALVGGLTEPVHRNATEEHDCC